MIKASSSNPPTYILPGAEVSAAAAAVNTPKGKRKATKNIVQRKPKATQRKRKATPNTEQRKQQPQATTNLKLLIQKIYQRLSKNDATRAAIVTQLDTLKDQLKKLSEREAKIQATLAEIERNAINEQPTKRPKLASDEDSDTDNPSQPAKPCSSQNTRSSKATKKKKRPNPTAPEDGKESEPVSFALVSSTAREPGHTHCNSTCPCSCLCDVDRGKSCKRCRALPKVTDKKLTGEIWDAAKEAEAKIQLNLGMTELSDGKYKFYPESKYNIIFPH